MEAILLITLAIIFGAMNGWLSADSYNKEPFNEYDQRGIYRSIPFLFPLLATILWVTPAILALVNKNIVFGIAVLILTIIATRLFGKNFFKKRVTAGQKHIQDSPHKRASGKNYSIDQLANLAIDQWNKKINAQSDTKNIYLNADIQGLELLSSAFSESESDEYAKWFVKEINHAIHNDLSRVMFMGSVSSSLAHPDEKTMPTELRRCSAPEAYYIVYNAGLKLIEHSHNLPKENYDSTNYYSNTLNSFGFYSSKIQNIANNFNMLAGNDFSRDEIIDLHFYKYFKDLKIKNQMFAETPDTEDIEDLIKYTQTKEALTFVNGFVNLGHFSSTAEYVGVCLFIKNYIDVFTMTNGQRDYLFPEIVKASQSGNDELFSELRESINVYSAAKKLSPFIAEILKKQNINDVHIVDKISVVQELLRASKSHNMEALQAEGVDVNLISNIILALKINLYDVTIFSYKNEFFDKWENSIIARGKSSINILGNKLPLIIETLVNSYDAEKCLNDNFSETIKKLNKASVHGEWTYDHIHNIDELGEELDTYSETIVYHRTKMTVFINDKEFIRLIEQRILEITKLKKQLIPFYHTYSDSELFYKACKLAIHSGEVSATILMNCFEISHERSEQIITHMLQRKIIKIEGDKSAELLVKTLDECVW